MATAGVIALQDARAAARAAGLHHVNSDDPGIVRRRRGKGFDYLHPDGRRVTDLDTRSRIRALAIPPAWSDVWICPDPDGHIQAVGRDARRRKQYRYHARWRVVRDEAKFDHLIEFADTLPGVRRRVDADLRRDGMPRDKVIAAVVRLLDRTLIRVGNEEYARHNDSFGLTTFRNRHVKVNGSTIEIIFRGKSGKHWRLQLDDPRLARVVKRCRDLPGQKLFTYVDGDGGSTAVGSADVNDYLRQVSGQPITSKDFRTWAATVATALALHRHGEPASKAGRKRCLNAAVKQAAAILGNTPAVCRRSYVHPVVIDTFVDGRLCAALDRCQAAESRARTRGLDRAERTVLRFLRQQQKAAPAARRAA